MDQKQGFMNILKNLAVNFFWVWSVTKKIILFLISLCKSHIWDKSNFLDIGQKDLGHSDCSIFKSALSREQTDEVA